ncbi:MAG: sulfotransferase domain-containing protein [Acidobacteriia bacterium]|nr:sulfotransferase domain-containing protein [Terriglobia bacterium]
MPTMRRVRFKLSKTGLRSPLLWIRHHGFRASDIFTASYPRSGSTWLRFILVELLAGQSSGFKGVNLLSPDVGEHSGAQALLPGNGRLIKTHELYRLSYKKAIYLARDPRDVMLSEYAYEKALGVIDEGLDAFLDAFLRKGVNPFGLWTDHVNTWLDAAEANQCELLIVRFEDMRRDTVPCLKQMMEFLNFPVDDSAIRKAVEGNSLEQMKAKEKVTPQRASAKGRFVGSGSVAGWKDKLTASQLQRIDQYAGGAMARLGYAPAGDLAETLAEVRA